jgi:hypothetical protein
MAEPLGQVVFKVPELGKAGYELQVKKEARQEKERKERESELYRTGGEKAYSDNIYKLQGRYKKEAELLFQELEKYGSQYQYSNDPSSLRKATEVSNRIKSVIDEYNVSVGTPLSAASKADSEGWEGYVDDRNTFNEKMYNLLNPEEIKDIKVENGQTLYQINGEWVPKESTPYGSKDPNQYNTVMVQKASNLGKYVVPSYFENENRYLSYKASSAEDAANGMVREFYFQLEENPELRADAAVAYAISLEMIPSENIPYQDMKKAIDKYQKDKLFKDEANDFYAKKLARVAANRWSTSNTSDFGPVGGEETATEDAVEGEQPSVRRAPVADVGEDELPMPSAKPKTAEERRIEAERRIDASRRGQTPNQGPPTAEEQVIKNIEESGDIQLDEVEEDFDPRFGIEEKTISVVIDAKGGRGKNNIMTIERRLPEYYTKNLLKFEGGISTDTGDAAAKPDRNKNAPIVNGKKAHTNKGVTYDKFETWAKAAGIPKSDYHKRFLNLTNAEALAVAEEVAASKGATNFKDPMLVGLFTQNAWGGGGIYGKTSGSAEYQSLLSMFKANGVKISNTGYVTEKDAAKIEALYKKNPKKFLDDYFDAYIVSHSRMDTIVKDEKGGAGYGKGAMVPTWMVNRNGWYSRANEFKKAIAEEMGIEYTPITPFNKTREYTKSVVDGKTVWRLVEEREGKKVPVGRTDWVDSYQPIK